MTKNRTEIVTRGLRLAGIADWQQPPNPEDAFLAGEALDGIRNNLIANLADDGITVTWDLDATPEDTFLPAARLLAHDMEKAARKPVTSARGPLYTILVGRFAPDNREIVGDLDEDGTLDDDEDQVAREAQYY